MSKKKKFSTIFLFMMWLLTWTSPLTCDLTWTWAPDLEWLGQIKSCSIEYKSNLLGILIKLWICVTWQIKSGQNGLKEIDLRGQRNIFVRILYENFPHVGLCWYNYKVVCYWSRKQANPLGCVINNLDHFTTWRCLKTIEGTFSLSFVCVLETTVLFLNRGLVKLVYSDALSRLRTRWLTTCFYTTSL